MNPSRKSADSWTRRYRTDAGRGKHAHYRSSAQGSEMGCCLVELERSVRDASTNPNDMSTVFDRLLARAGERNMIVDLAHR